MVRCHFYWQVQKGRTFQIMKASNHDEVTKFSGLCLHPQLSPLDVHRSWCRFGISYNPPLVKRVPTGDFVNVQEAFGRDVRHAKSSRIHPQVSICALYDSSTKGTKTKYGNANECYRYL